MTKSLRIIFLLGFLSLFGCQNRKASVIQPGGGTSPFGINASCFSGASPTLERVTAGTVRQGDTVQWRVTLPSSCNGNFLVSVNGAAEEALSNPYTFNVTYDSTGFKTENITVRYVGSYDQGPNTASATANVTVDDPLPGPTRSCFLDALPTLTRVLPASAPFYTGTAVTWRVTMPVACTGTFFVSVNSGPEVLIASSHDFNRTYATAGTKTESIRVRSIETYDEGPNTATVNANISITAAPAEVTCTIAPVFAGQNNEVIQGQTFDVILSYTGNVSSANVGGFNVVNPPNPHSITSAQLNTLGTFTVNSYVTPSSGGSNVDCNSFTYTVVAPPVQPTCTASVNKTTLIEGDDITYTVNVVAGDATITNYEIDGTTYGYSSSPATRTLSPSVGSHNSTVAINTSMGRFVCSPDPISYTVNSYVPPQCTSFTLNKTTYTPGESMSATVQHSGPTTSVTIGASVFQSSGNSFTITAPANSGNYAINANVSDGTTTDNCPGPVNYTVEEPCQRLFVGTMAGAGTGKGRDYYSNQCNTLASNAGLGGSWKALLSLTNSNAKDYAPISGPVCNMVGETIAPNQSAFWEFASASMAYDQNGSPLTVSVMTGSDGNGNYPSSCSSCSGGPCKRSGYSNCNCNNYSYTGDSGVGLVTGTSTETGNLRFWSWLTSQCRGGTIYVYCLED